MIKVKVYAGSFDQDGVFIRNLLVDILNFRDMESAKKYITDNIDRQRYDCILKLPNGASVNSARLF